MTALRRSPLVEDGAFLFVLCAIALLGFHDVFSGWTFLEAGLTGVLLGMALVVLMRRFRQPTIVLTVCTVAGFFLFGGLVALHALGATYLVPMPRTISELAEVSVHGWKDIVTTLPPVDPGSLLVIPYLIGLVAGAAGLALAARMRSAGVPAIVPVATLALVITLGVKDPQRAATLAAVFTAVAIAWVVVRNRRGRLRPATADTRRIGRRAVAVVLCGGTAALAIVAGPNLPGRKAQREVLRSYVVPPLNVEQYPSPLVGFRRFTSGYKLTDPADELYDKPLFEVSGLPKGTTIRIATLDSYDGLVWGAGNIAGSAVPDEIDSDTFQRVGHVISDPAPGQRVSGSVRIDDGAALGVWVPEVGALTGLDFHGSRTCSDHAYYNLTSSTAVNTAGLVQCDAYTFSAVVSPTQFSPRSELASGTLPGVAAATQFQQTAVGIAGKSSDPAATVEALSGYLQQNGHLTDGEGDYSQYTAGHSLYRLQLFMSQAGQLAGDEEQFSAMLALLANDLNIPARVVVGVQSLPSSGSIVIKGSNISAWVEVQAQDGRWEDLPTSLFMPTKPPQPQNPQPQTNKPAANIPPPAPVHPPGTAGEPLNASLNHRASPKSNASHFPAFILAIAKWVVIPLALIALIAAVIIGLKALRRNRRRTRGSPAHRLAGAWNELLDYARDYGHRAPTRATRREQALALGIPSLQDSARWADNTMFGSASPSDVEVERYWSHTDELRRQMWESSGRWPRIRAALNVVTLRPRGLLHI